MNHYKPILLKVTMYNWGRPTRGVVHLDINGMIQSDIMDCINKVINPYLSLDECSKLIENAFENKGGEIL